MTMFALGYLACLATLAAAVLAGKALAAASPEYRQPTYAWKEIALLRGSTKPNGEERA